MGVQLKRQYPGVAFKIFEKLAHLEPYIELNQECLTATWTEERSTWAVQFCDLNTGKEYTRESKVLITAAGVLNVPKGRDDVPTLKSFKGDVMHTSNWRDTDWHGKKVLVLGNGCSANQVVPWLLEKGRVKKLVQIVRSEQWVAPKVNSRHSEVFKWVLRNVPLAARVYRLWKAFQMDRGLPAYKKTTPGAAQRKKLEDAIKNYMANTAAKKYHDILIPKYPFGAKRPVLDHGYLQATNLDNFELIKGDGISAIGNDGHSIIDTQGGHHDVDTVILANGFKTQELLTPMQILGRDGRDLREQWNRLGGARAYMGVAVSGFPNLFILTGPNTLPSGNSTLHGIECSVTYILRVLKPLFTGKSPRSSTIMVKAAAEDAYNEKLQRWMQEFVYSTDVDTYFINKQSGRNTLVWPGSQFSFYWSRCVQGVKWADYEFGRTKKG
ncbi:MAG: hypothetical protein Q9217_004257 [Psora testacea]